MRVISKKILREFWEIHSDCEEPLKSWYQEVYRADWKNNNELKLQFPSASILKDNRDLFQHKRQ